LAVSVTAMPLSRRLLAFTAAALSIFTWASALTTVGGGGQPGAGALDHGVALQLREGGHDGEHGRAHRPIGV